MFWAIMDWIGEKVPLWIKKLIFLSFGIASVIGMPIIGAVSGHSIVETNVAGRSPWRSEQDARAGQWDWPVILGVTGLVVGGLILIAAIIYFFTAEQQKKKSIWR